MALQQGAGQVNNFDRGGHDLVVVQAIAAKGILGCRESVGVNEPSRTRRANALITSTMVMREVNNRSA